MSPNREIYETQFDRYMEHNINPWGLRVQVFPNIRDPNPEFKTKWEKILNKCSEGLMDLLKEHHHDELSKIQKELAELEIKSTKLKTNVITWRDLTKILFRIKTKNTKRTPEPFRWVGHIGGSSTIQVVDPGIDSRVLRYLFTNSLVPLVVRPTGLTLRPCFFQSHAAHEVYAKHQSKRGTKRVDFDRGEPSGSNLDKRKQKFWRRGQIHIE